jgi:hypothetical protein
MKFAAPVKGTFWAPHRKMKLGRAAEFEGAIIAGWIKTKVESTVTHTPFAGWVE